MGPVIEDALIRSGRVSSLADVVRRLSCGFLRRQPLQRFRFGTLAALLLGFVFQHLSDAKEIVCQHGGSNQNFEPHRPFSQAAFHAASAKQNGDAAFDAGPKALAAFEGWRSFRRGLFRASAAALVWNANLLDSRLLAGRTANC